MHQLIARNHRGSTPTEPLLVASAQDQWAGTFQSSATLDFGSLGVQADDFVVIALAWSGSNGITSIKDADNVAFGLSSTFASTDGRATHVAFGYRKATSAQAAYSVDVVLSDTCEQFAAMAYVLRGADFTFNAGVFAGDESKFTTDPISMALDTGSRAFVAVVALDDYTGQGAFTVSPIDFTVDHNDATNNYMVAAHWLIDAEEVATVQVGDPGDGNSGYNRILGAVAAFNY